MGIIVYWGAFFGPLLLETLMTGVCDLKDPTKELCCLDQFGTKTLP